MPADDGLAIRSLTVAYGRRPPVLREIDLDVRPGRMVALLGPNGSGKSTLIHAMLGLLPVRSGTVRLWGEPMAAVQRRMVGFCADDLPLPTLLTGSEFLRFSAAARSVTIDPGITAALFEGMHMAGAEGRLIREYSHGMKRKLMVLANVLHDPELLILDEPFRGLDLEAHAVLRAVLRSAVERGAIVLVSTHDLGVASELCDEVLILRDGRVGYHGDVSEGTSMARELADRFTSVSYGEEDSLQRAEALFETLARVGRS